ncbi:MAG: tRNA (adenosine(37)-N6)-threonylcarbamoyltransferase complex ATPase subunit type 1 TsaE [Bacteroidota bacterium]|nr:tRNA (adenosine(37)-N6)-threonylcarbamoyltransferase complex ATPase subunit type 1 TsaE [Bacteroidota bacterium]
MKKQWFCKSLKGLNQIARELLEEYSGKSVFALYGAMGAGKTTFVKALCQELGVIENVSSPTFSIINEYKTDTGSRVFHFDFYRIKKIEEAYDIGYEDYFYSGEYCFIEWPEMIEELLPENCVYLKIEEMGNQGERQFLIEK